MLVGEPSPEEVGKRALLGDLVLPRICHLARLAVPSEPPEPLLGQIHRADEAVAEAPGQGALPWAPKRMPRKKQLQAVVVNTNGIPFWLVGAPPRLVYFQNQWDPILVGR